MKITASNKVRFFMTKINIYTKISFSEVYTRHSDNTTGERDTFYYAYEYKN